MTKIRFIVIKEHTLCYVFDNLPQWPNVLSASIIRGSPYKDGPIPLPATGVRPATKQDFETFRVHLSDSYLDETRYYPLA